MQKINIPTALSKREGNLLTKLSKYKKVVEIGSLLGYSTVKLAQKSQYVTSIDRHKDYPYKNAPSTFRTLKNNLWRYNINNVNVIVNEFQKVKIAYHDMAFIDLDGTYKTTLKALKSVKHIPLIVIHDFDRQNCKGVKQAVKKYGKPFRVIDTCVIIDNKIS